MAAILPAHAAKPRIEVGLRLLKAQIPADASLRHLTCEELARAVHGATRARRADAVQILVAALSLDEWDARRKEEDRLSCVCVVRLFHAAAAAAPERAVILLETTEALYPDCAEGLTAALRGLEGRITVAASSDGNFSSPDGGDADSGGLTTGSGTGPGFPGSPGFGGSGPSGAFALPTPGPAPVTSVVNN